MLKQKQKLAPTGRIMRILLLGLIMSTGITFLANAPLVDAETKKFSVFCPGSEAQIEKDTSIGFPPKTVPFFVSCKSGVGPQIKSPPESTVGSTVALVDVNCGDKLVFQTSTNGRFLCGGSVEGNPDVTEPQTIQISGQLSGAPPATADDCVADSQSATPIESKACINVKSIDSACVGATDKATDKDGNPIKLEEYCGLFDYISNGIKLLSAIIGIVATVMIIVGGIKYSAAGADPNKVMKAKSMIFKAIFMLVGYGLLFAVAQWLIPAGIL